MFIGHRNMHPRLKLKLIKTHHLVRTESRNKSHRILEDSHESEKPDDCTLGFFGALIRATKKLRVALTSTS